jgi:hypothetical protein
LGFGFRGGFGSNTNVKLRLPSWALLRKNVDALLMLCSCVVLFVLLIDPNLTGLLIESVYI